MAITRIKNNQVTDASAGNVYLGINAAVKLQDYSVTAGKIANSLVYGSDLTVTGNLTVNGQTTTIDTVSVVIEDPILYLAANQTGSPSLDIGFIGERGTSQNIAFVWDESVGEFVTVFTNDTTTNSTVTIASYADFHTNNANIGGNIVINGTTSFVGNIISPVNITGNFSAGNISTPGQISAVGNISGGNVNVVANVETANLRVTSMTANLVTFTDPNDYLITSQNFSYDGVTANIQGVLVVDGFTINGTDITSSANILITSNAGNANIDITPTGTGVVNIGNITIANNIIGSSSANIVLNPAANIVLPDETASAVLYLTAQKEIETSSNFVYDGTTANIQGALVIDNVKVDGNDISTTNTNGNLTITPNGTGGLIVDAENSNFLGNLTTSGNLVSNAAVIATGNVSGGNLSAGSGIISTTGNVNGGNVNATSAITAGTTINATGNITGGNLTTAGITSTGSLTASTTINATGNITGGNLITTGVTSTGTLETTGNALIGGNLVVQGNITYINIDDLRVEDPIIILGTGPNGAPLIVNDGKDRGIFMEYYTTGIGNAFMGFDNSSGNMVIASNAFFTGNDIVGINSYGTLEVGNVFGQSAVFIGNVNAGNLISQGAVIGNVQITGNLALGNLSVSGVINTTGNITGGNLVSNAAITAGTTINATGNITGGNLTTAGITSTGSLTASTTINATGNITGGNIDTAGQVVATGNITGGNVSTAGITSTGSLTASTTINATGNITGGNLTTTGITSTGSLTASTTINATGNITGGNLSAGSGIISTTGNVNGGNVNATAAVTGANLIATGNVTGANVVGTTSGTFGNIVISGDDITDTNGRVNFNTAGADVDFAVNGDTRANVFYVDAGTGTASFGSATQTTGAGVAFNYTNSVLLPVGNSAQRPSGVTGMVRFNTTLDSLEFYDADGWISAGTVFTVIDSQVFNGDGTTVAFTLDSDQTTDSCIVSINGVVQIPVTAYAVAGTILTFTEAPLSQDVIEVRKITTTVTVKAISNSVGNAVIEVEDTSSNVYITGNLVPIANNTQDLGSETLRWKDGYFSGNSITLGNIVLKNTTGNTLSFFGPDGTTPGVLSSNNVDTTSIANGNASVQTLSASGNVVMTSGGVAQLITYPGGVVIPGNLLVEGTETIINVSNLNVEDPILALGRGANNTPLTSDDDKDRGVEMWYYITGVGEKAAYMGWEDSANTMIMAQDVSIANNVVTINNYGSVRVGSLLTSGILNTNANGVGNIGNSSTYFNTAFIKATSAQYADLAENYEADAMYEPGTVVCFGGAKEVTVCDVADSTRVAGVISTNPSYLMNSGQTGEHVAAVALQGRVPTKVTGQICKGDLIVSAGDGRGRANNDARAGTIIGKALADFDGQDGVIEVVVGRV
jgi:filamentous hemagglutinin